MIKNIAVFGASTTFGLPVTKALVSAGFNVSVLSVDTDAEKELLPEGVELVEGNWMYHHDLKGFLKGKDAVYCCLNVDLKERPEDFHAESDGLREIINASLEVGIRRLAYMSSILQYSQVENDNLWWVFRVKSDAVNFVRDSGIPYTIFYPSTFMENFNHTYRHGKSIRVFGESEFPVYFVSVEDYAKMVVKSLQSLGTKDREYFIQGLNCYKINEAAKLFIKHHQSEKLKYRMMPLWQVKLYAWFNPSFKFIYDLSDSLNQNNETFMADETWMELGKPEITFTEFARKS